MKVTDENKEDLQINSATKATKMKGREQKLMAIEYRDKKLAGQEVDEVDALEVDCPYP